MYLDFKVKIPSDSPGITRKKIKGATYIVDISQLQYTLEKAGGYEFVIMMKGMKQLVKSLVLEVKGTFEEDRRYSPGRTGSRSDRRVTPLRRSSSCR